MTFKMKSMPQAILRVIASGALSAIVIYPAMAQEVIDDSATQKIVITGSNISRADKEGVSPVQMITSEDMKKSGYTSVADVLQNLTANGQGALNQGFNQAFAAGGSGISLRGLTTAATLVLIDGHRMSPYPLSDDGQRSFVDISNIPFDAVERIDILKDGASAIYGSDAIAGVVNVILKKSYVGTNVSAEAGGSQEGGGATTHMTFTHGFGDLDKDGYTGYVSAEFRHADAIRLDQRTDKDWANGDFTSRGGINITPGVPNILNGGLPSFGSSPFLYNPTSGTYAFTGNCNATTFAAGGCAVKDTYSELQPQTENINILASFTKKLAGDWQINVKASLFDSKDQVAEGAAYPASFPGSHYNGNTAIGPGQIPTQVGGISAFTVPANYPGNTTGGAASVYGVIPGLAAPQDMVDSKSYRVVADLTGSWNGWDLNASVGYTRIVTDQTFTGTLDRTALYNALNSTTNPFLITGGNSAAMMASISPTVQGQATDELDFAEVRGSHELWDLPGGAMQVSVGSSFIHRALNDIAPALFSSGQVAGSTAYAIGQQNDAAAYAEFVAPVLKSLEIDAAARVDHYDTYGNSSTPKVGFKWSPIREIAFRGTFSKGFRAPNPAENGQAGSKFGSVSINDPILCPDGKASTAGNAVAYCSFSPAYIQTTTKDLQPERSTSDTFGIILEPVKGWSTTIDYYNIKIKDQIVSAAALPDFVPTYVRGPVVPQTIALAGGGTTQAIPASGVGNILYAETGYVNANSTQTTGIDLDTSYRFNLGDYGSLKTEFMFTHLFSYELTANGETYQLAGTHGPTVIGGDTGTPKDRAQAIFSYDKGNYNVTTTFDWVGSYDVTDPSAGLNDCVSGISSGYGEFANTSTPPSQYCKIGSFLSTNLTLTYKPTKNWTIHGTVLNLFNRQPPVDVETYGAAGEGVAAYNPALHQAGAVGRFFNVGASYRF